MTEDAVKTITLPKLPTEADIEQEMIDEIEQTHREYIAKERGEEVTKEATKQVEEKIIKPIEQAGFVRSEDFQKIVIDMEARYTDLLGKFNELRTFALEQKARGNFNVPAEKPVMSDEDKRVKDAWAGLDE